MPASSGYASPVTHMTALVLALDFGGSKLAAALVDAASGRVVSTLRCATPADAEASYAAMLALARALLIDAPDHPHAVGVSFGGPVQADGRVVRLSMHVPGWNDAPLADWIERDLGLPCAIANDADAAALAEQRYGAGRGLTPLLYLTVSTGIGGGIVIDRRMFRGARAWAGEVGHQTLDPNGPLCACGRRGCLEALASGLSIARAARQELDANEASSLANLPRDQVDARAVAAAAAAGDPLAGAVWDAAMGWLGIGIANAANVLNPACVVLGGGLTQAGDQLFAPVRRIVAERALDPALTVVPAALGEHVGVLGGVAIACNTLWKG